MDLTFSIGMQQILSKTLLVLIEKIKYDNLITNRATRRTSRMFGVAKSCPLDLFDPSCSLTHAG